MDEPRGHDYGLRGPCHECGAGLAPERITALRCPACGDVRNMEKSPPANAATVHNCGECGHATHGEICFNMASDSECDCTAGRRTPALSSDVEKGILPLESRIEIATAWLDDYANDEDAPLSDAVRDVIESIRELLWTLRVKLAQKGSAFEAAALASDAHKMAKALHSIENAASPDQANFHVTRENALDRLEYIRNATAELAEIITRNFKYVAPPDEQARGER